MNVPNKHYQDWLYHTFQLHSQCASATNLNFYGDAMMQPKNKNFYVNVMCVKRNRLNFNNEKINQLD